MDVVFEYRGRRVTESDLGQIRDLIAGNPQASRRSLSKKLCEAWQWQQPNGVPRDMGGRGLMLGRAAPHYLGYTQPVGEHLKYLVCAGERPLALFAWSSAPRHLDPRDRFIGWSIRARQGKTRFGASNTTFLILSW